MKAKKKNVSGVCFPCRARSCLTVGSGNMGPKLVAGCSLRDGLDGSNARHNQPPSSIARITFILISVTISFDSFPGEAQLLSVVSDNP